MSVRAGTADQSPSRTSRRPSSRKLAGGESSRVAVTRDVTHASQERPEDDVSFAARSRGFLLMKTEFFVSFLFLYV